MVRVYIKHADKLYNNGGSKKFPHDPGIKKDSSNFIRTLTLKLIDIVGLPEYIVTSPYLRTRETISIMRNTIKEYCKTEHITDDDYSPPYIRCDILLSEYLGNQKKRLPSYQDLTPETNKYKPPLYENFEQFKARVFQHDLFYKRLDCKKASHWFVTHGIFIEMVCKANNVYKPCEINPLLSLIIKGCKGKLPILGYLNHNENHPVKLDPIIWKEEDEKKLIDKNKNNS